VKERQRTGKPEDVPEANEYEKEELAEGED